MPAHQRPPWTEALAHPLRSFHTVRHLHPRQIAWRAARGLQRLPDLPDAETAPRLPARTAVPPADDDSRAFDGASFCFLNRRIRCSGADRWYPPGAEALWVYNLHYFRYLWSVGAATGRDLVDDWIQANTVPGTPAWDPYPISLRVREWLEWLFHHDCLDADFRSRVARSIVQQTEALCRRLEFHLMGNHLLENAITLCWAGLTFAGERADEWADQGAGLLREELNTQVLCDGSHSERSPMYQALLAEAILRLGEVAAQSSSHTARAIEEMARASGQGLLSSLELLVHPDGDYALVNDAALRVAPRLNSLRRRFGGRRPFSPMRRAWGLDAAGYLGYRTGSGDYLVFDAGPIGPDHQPGHGHADTLSFELTHAGRRVITDTGVLTYAVGPMRQYDRSTAAHNTVQIDGRDQSEMWGSFRCARRATIHTACIHEDRTGTTLVGGYRGPGRGLRRVDHTREVFAADRLLAFSDEVSASGDRSATLRLHFAPGLRLRKTIQHWTVEEESGRRIASVVGDSLEWRASSSPYHPEFGREEERASLVATMRFRDRLTAKWWLLLS